MAFKDQILLCTTRYDGNDGLNMTDMGFLSNDRCMCADVHSPWLWKPLCPPKKDIQTYLRCHRTSSTMSTYHSLIVHKPTLPNSHESSRRARSPCLHPTLPSLLPSPLASPLPQERRLQQLVHHRQRRPLHRLLQMVQMRACCCLRRSTEAE